MSGKKYVWHRIANSPEELPLSEAGSICELQVSNKNICIARHNNTLYAFTSKCPHAGGFLSDGYIDVRGYIVCPVHRYRFDMTNGRNVSGEGYYLKTYPLEVRESGLYVGFETGGFF